MIVGKAFELDNETAVGGVGIVLAQLVGAGLPNDVNYVHIQ